MQHVRHEGCPNNGWLTHRSEPLYGRTVERCDACGYSGVITARVAKKVVKKSAKQKSDDWAERKRQRLFDALPLGRVGALRIEVLAQNTGMTKRAAIHALNVLVARRINVRYTNVISNIRGGHKTYRVFWRDA